MATALCEGERFLSPWPSELADGDLRYLQQPAATAAATVALAALRMPRPEAALCCRDALMALSK